MTPEQVDAFVGALPVKKIPGVGSVTAEKMHRYGLKTCADIREWELHDLIRRFGKFGVVLHERARGKDERRSSRAASANRSALKPPLVRTWQDPQSGSLRRQAL